MNRLFTCQFSNYPLTFCAIMGFSICICTRAAESQGTHAASPPSIESSMDRPVGGVLAESYHYHRHGYASDRPAHPTIAPAAGWYGYGFPVQTYRWGWFGAERYYPRVVWHRGYYGDCCRWSYRQGY